MLKHIGEESKKDCDCVPIIGNYLCWMKAVRRVIQSLYCASAHNQSITVMDSVSVNTDHFVPGLMLPRSSLWNILLCPQISSISQTNPWLMTRSVRGRRGIEGKFGEISGTNDVQSVTTGQYPHNLYRGYWQTFVSYKTSWVIAENIILIEMGLKTEPRPHVTISIRLWHTQSWRRNYKKFTSTKCTNIKKYHYNGVFWAN